MKKFAKFCKHSGIIVACLALGIVTAQADVGAARVTKVSVANANGTVRGDRVNVRSRPSTTAEVVAQLNKGDAVEVHETKSVTEAGKSRDWLRITLPASAKCYVAAKFITAGAINDDGINVRSGPGTNYREVGKLTKGEQVTVVKTDGEWSQIKPTAHCSGWVSADLIQVTAAPVIESTPVISEVITPPVAAPLLPAPAATEVKVVSTDPDVHVRYIIKVGVLKAVTDEANAPGAYQLMTPETMRLESRMAYIESPEIDLARYQEKLVRLQGNERWRKGDRFPVIVVDRVDLVR